MTTEIKFHCSSLSKLVVEPRDKGAKERGELSETTKAHLLEVYAYHKYGRTRDFDNKYMEKGRLQEEDSIDLLSRHTKLFIKKNKETLSNDFIIGTPDTPVYDDCAYEIKTSWDLVTFLEAKTSKIDKGYEWQCKGYADLYKCKQVKLVYCLVNAPAHLIDQAKSSAQWKLFREIGGDFAAIIGTDEYQKQCAQIERNMIFDLDAFSKHYPSYPLFNQDLDIAREDRIHIFTVDSDADAMQKAYQRVVTCREYIKNTFITALS